MRISTSVVTRGIVLVAGALIVFASFTFVRGLTAAPAIEWQNYSHATFEEAVAALGRRSV